MIGAAVPVPARLGRRLGALLYEALLLAALLLVSGFVLLPLTSSSIATGPVLRIPPVATRVINFCLLFALLALYCVMLWSDGRRTLAMKTWRLSLVRRDGVALDRRTALLRYLVEWIGPCLALLAYLPLHRLGLGAYAMVLLLLNFAWAFFDPDRQFLHDRLAGTLLIIDGPAVHTTEAVAQPSATVQPPAR